MLLKSKLQKLTISIDRNCKITIGRLSQWPSKPNQCCMKCLTLLLAWDVGQIWSEKYMN